MNHFNPMLPLLMACLLTGIFCSCSTWRKLEYIRTGNSDAKLSLQQEHQAVALSTTDDPKPQDTIRIKDLSGKDVFLMRAVKDEDGEMIASEVLEPAVVTASFRNVAERMGQVDLHFRIHVPAMLQDPTWQIRFYPQLLVQEDTLTLLPVLITGTDYRQRQIRGYRAYERFLASIIRDSNLLRYQELMQIFNDRNHDNFQDVSPGEVLKHYERSGRIFLNNRKTSRISEFFRRRVKAPYYGQPIYLDTPAVASPAAYDYHYTLKTRPRLRKAELYLTGEIWKDGNQLYQMPSSFPLTFYISSIATLMEDRTRFVQQIVERKALTRTMAYIDFAQGSTRIDTTLHENAAELARIQSNIQELISHDTFVLDSLVITASCSPEGSYALNTRLAQERGNSILNHLKNQITTQQARIQEERNQTLYLNWAQDSTLLHPSDSISEREAFSFISHTIPEDWDRLQVLVQRDSLLTCRASLLELIRQPLEPDLKEKKLRIHPDYRRLYQVLYPLIRTVRFDFHLHRRGMVKDTVHTTEIDTLYEAGKKALQERDFERALTLLRPYHDLNTAIACLCMDYNLTAREILESLDANSKRNYLLALTHARLNEQEKALKYLVHSIQMDPSLQFRGNLDPEIARLMHEFNLNEQ